MIAAEAIDLDGGCIDLLELFPAKLLQLVALSQAILELFPAEPYTGQRGAAVQRLDLPPTALVYSYEHQVRVSR